jgi:TATA-binding protein-associated factor Taf7
LNPAIVTDAIISLRQIDALLENIQHKQKYTNGDLVTMVLATAQIEKIDDLLKQKEKEVTEQRWISEPLNRSVRKTRQRIRQKNETVSDRSLKLG